MGWLVALAVVAGCGGGGPVEAGPDSAVQPFVGTWDAVVFRVTSVAEPAVVADLLENGSFNINIQPSGLYTATLVLGDGQGTTLDPFVEIGQLIVSGAFLTLRPNGPNPCPASSEYSFSGPNFLTLEGPTCFDFNLDGEDEEARARLELQRRP